jgi:hypothetical protein
VAQSSKSRAHGGPLHNNDLGKPRFRKAYGFAIITGAFFLVSWAGQFFAQLLTERNEAEQHGESFQWADFLPSSPRSPTSASRRSWTRSSPSGASIPTR